MFSKLSCVTRTRSVVFTLQSIQQHYRGSHVCGVNMEDDTLFILVSAVIASSSTRRSWHRRARPTLHYFCLSPFSLYSGVALCASTTKHETARVPPCTFERAPIAGYVRSPHGMHLLVGDCCGSGKNRVLSQSCTSGRKKDCPY